MSLRNFWIEIEVDGRKRKIAAGSKLIEGTNIIKIYQRCNGESVLAGTITCSVESEKLTTEVFLAENPITKYETYR
jgi:hypothetical protein